MILSATRDQAASLARSYLALDAAGRPACRDSAAILNAVAVVLETGDGELIDELLLSGFLRGSAERYDSCIQPNMQVVPASTFSMGSDARDARQFCGESPRHTVSLSSYAIGVYPVTNSLFRLLDRRTVNLSARELAQPVVEVTWSDAALFAMWVGCRLPTEAEWENACAGGEGEWCCGQESDLRRYAWYSENSHGKLRLVATREPNQRGLFDMHGNVWEWCEDDYDPGFYRRSPRRDPVCHLTRVAESPPHKVSRGGSVHSLAEMCRARYRLHDPPWFFARDLGFRLVKDHQTGREARADAHTDTAIAAVRARSGA